MIASWNRRARDLLPSPYYRCNQLQAICNCFPELPSTVSRVLRHNRATGVSLAISRYPRRRLRYSGAFAMNHGIKSLFSGLLVLAFCSAASAAGPPELNGQAGGAMPVYVVANQDLTLPF